MNKKENTFDQVIKLKNQRKQNKIINLQKYREKRWVEDHWEEIVERRRQEQLAYEESIKEETLKKERELKLKHEKLNRQLEEYAQMDITDEDERIEREEHIRHERWRMKRERDEFKISNVRGKTTKNMSIEEFCEIASAMIRSSWIGPEFAFETGINDPCDEGVKFPRGMYRKDICDGYRAISRMALVGNAIAEKYISEGESIFNRKRAATSKEKIEFFEMRNIQRIVKGLSNSLKWENDYDKYTDEEMEEACDKLLASMPKIEDTFLRAILTYARENGMEITF